MAAASAASAWAVGYNNGHGGKTLILRLNGTKWQRVPSPSPDAGCIGAVLWGFAATPADAWAVGGYACAPRTLTLRWNGTAWKQVPSPSPAGSNFLQAVAIIPTGGALAVGSAHGGTGAIFLEHWTGAAWTWPRTVASSATPSERNDRWGQAIEVPASGALNAGGPLGRLQAAPPASVRTASAPGARTRSDNSGSRDRVERQFDAARGGHGCRPLVDVTSWPLLGA